MEHTIEKGIYGVDGDVWRFYSVEEAEKHKSKCKNWPSVLEDLKKYIGHKWFDKSEIRYKIDDKPVYKSYKIIGIEDNRAYCDYYWILEDEKKNKKFVLTNLKEFYENIV